MSDTPNAEDRPYRCGAFVTATREVCTLESDHDGKHVFASDTPNADPLSVNMDERLAHAQKRALLWDAFRHQPHLWTFVDDVVRAALETPDE